MQSLPTVKGVVRLLSAQIRFLSEGRMSVLRVKDPNSCAIEAEVGDREGKMSLV